MLDTRALGRQWLDRNLSLADKTPCAFSGFAEPRAFSGAFGGG